MKIKTCFLITLFAMTFTYHFSVMSQSIEPENPYLFTYHRTYHSAGRNKTIKVDVYLNDQPYIYDSNSKSIIKNPKFANAIGDTYFYTYDSVISDIFNEYELQLIKRQKELKLYERNKYITDLSNYAGQYSRAVSEFFMNDLNASRLDNVDTEYQTFLRSKLKNLIDNKDFQNMNLQLLRLYYGTAKWFDVFLQMYFNYTGPFLYTVQKISALDEKGLTNLIESDLNENIDAKVKDKAIHSINPELKKFKAFLSLNPGILEKVLADPIYLFLFLQTKGLLHTDHDIMRSSSLLKGSQLKDYLENISVLRDPKLIEFYSHFFNLLSTFQKANVNIKMGSFQIDRSRETKSKGLFNLDFKFVLEDQKLLADRIFETYQDSFNLVKRNQIKSCEGLF